MVGATVPWSLWAWVHTCYLATPAPVSDMPQWARWLPDLGLILFAIGWVVVGAGLRPLGSAVTGAALVLVLYFAIGLVWILASTPFGPITIDFAADLLSPCVPLIALFWPLYVRIQLGLLGPGMSIG